MSRKLTTKEAKRMAQKRVNPGRKAVDRFLCLWCGKRLSVAESRTHRCVPGATFIVPTKPSSPGSE